MREANTTAAGTKSTGPQKWEAPQTIREMADKGTARTKEAYDKMSAATAEASNLVQNAYSTAAQGATDFNAKLIEFALANSNAAFDHASQLLGVKSPSEFLEVSTSHGRKQLEVLSEQKGTYGAKPKGDARDGGAAQSRRRQGVSRPSRLRCATQPTGAF
jgi:phasin